MKKFKRIFLNERFILLLILANAVLIFIQEFQLTGNWTDYLESIFTLLFLTEMIVKINIYGFKKYLSTGWNRLDFAVIILALPSLAAIFFDNIVELNFFLALRVFRVFKFFRFFRFFKGIDPLIAGVQRAIKASYLVMVGFFMLVFITSILSCSLFKTIAPEYFSNPLQAFYSTFQLFSTDSWHEIPGLIASRTTPLTAILAKIYFVIIMFCGGILGLSLVNSIFVDAMVSDNNDTLEKEVLTLTKKIEKLTEKIEQLTTENNYTNTNSHGI